MSNYVVFGGQAVPVANIITVSSTGLWHSTGGSLDTTAYVGANNQIVVTNPTGNGTSWITVGPDVSYAANVWTVVGIQGNKVSNAAPANDQVFVTGHTNTTSYWVTVGPDLSFAANTWTVTGLQGRALSSSAPGAGQAIAWNGSSWIPTTVGNTSSVTGTGVWTSTSGALNAAASLGANDTLLVTNHTANNFLWAVPGGDVKYASNNFTVTGLQGNPVNNASPSNNQVLQWNGSAWLPATISSTKTVNLIKTANQNVTNSTVLVNETALVVPMAATDNVTATWTLWVPSNARGGIQTAITIPGSATLLAVTEAIGAAASVQSTTANGAAMSFANTVFVGGLVRVIASVQGDGSTAGNITLQFAQQASNSNATTIQSGSSVTAIKQ